MNIKLNRKKREVKTKGSLKEESKDLNFAYIAANAAEEKKGENILLLDVSKLTTISDYFLIVTAKSTSQVEAVSSYIEEKLTELNYKLVSKEGFVTSNWIVLDFGNLVVHVMHQKERDYYKIERFWSNATLIDNKLWKMAS